MFHSCGQDSSCSEEPDKIKELLLWYGCCMIWRWLYMNMFSFRLFLPQQLFLCSPFICCCSHAFTIYSPFTLYLVACVADCYPFNFTFHAIIPIVLWISFLTVFILPNQSLTLLSAQFFLAPYSTTLLCITIHLNTLPETHIHLVKQLPTLYSCKALHTSGTISWHNTPVAQFE